MSRYLAVASALAILAVCGVVHGLRAERWHTSAALEHAMARVEHVPLEIGDWKALAIESGAVNFELRSPTSETLLLVMRGREVPAGRLARIADKAVEQARQWLEELA